MRRHFYFLTSLLFSTLIHAQQHGVCGHDIVMEQLEQRDPELFRQQMSTDSLLLQLVQTEEGPEGIVHYVPVVVHVMYADDEDNISREQILDGLRVLNEDFRRLNADASNTRAIFQSRSVDSEIEFRLATKDPNGNCHPGIVRKQSSLAVSASDNVKSGFQGSPSWPNDEYLNIWTVRTINVGAVPGGGTVLGYAYRPTTNQSSTLDGVVIRHDEFGSIGSARTLGRTLTHEVGHYLGLRHPFNSNNNACIDGDGLGDTPIVQSPNFGCPVGVNSCSNEVPDEPDMVENFMDYADNSCQNAFTTDQKNVMKQAIGNFSLRGDVTASNNLTRTGIEGYDCVPTSFFIAEQRAVCEGGSIQFISRPIEGNAQTYSWNFPGGSPASSSDENPLVTYNQAGTYPVTLTLSNPNGSATSTVQSYVLVSSPNTAQDHQLSEDFETNAFPGTDWGTLSDADYYGFEHYANAGYQSGSSIRLNNYLATKGQTDWLYSKSLDVRFASTLSLRFNYAFATKETGDNDALRIAVSDDCGQNWQLVRIINTNILSTGGQQTMDWAPAGDAEWDEYVVNLNSYAGSTNPIQIRWEFLSGGGNNLYLDNINIDATLSKAETEVNSLRLFPNPTAGELTLQSRNPLSEVPQVWATDLSGRQMALLVDKQGIDWKISLPESLSDGVYLIQVVSEEGQWNERLILRR